jgi:hypothetical protein
MHCQKFPDSHKHAIPCPEHQNDLKGWVHKTVPLLEKKRTEGDLRTVL